MRQHTAPCALKAALRFGGMADEPATPAAKRSGVFLGACGFSYDEWEGVVFPAGLPKNARLSSYARQFRLVELDSTYYGTPRPEAVKRWAEQTPEGFVFTAKVPKQVTQEAKLVGLSAQAELSRFIATMKLLGPRLGPLVFQMSPGFRYPRDFKGLRETLEALPALGGERVRFAIEFRHPSWLSKEEPAALLREHGVAWVWNDWLPTEKYLAPMPRAMKVAARLERTGKTSCCPRSPNCRTPASARRHSSPHGKRNFGRTSVCPTIFCTRLAWVL